MLTPAKTSLSLFLGASLLVALSSSPAAAETKGARKGDTASSYQLDDQGRFYRVIDGRRCQITDRVADFKISQHKTDVAVAYYVRRSAGTADLFGLYPSSNEYAGRGCPAVKKDKLVSGLARKRGKYRYSITSNSKTAVVAIALSRAGRLYAWSSESTVLRLDEVTDYKMHNKYGVRGAPFSRYVGFAIDRDGSVLKVNGSKPAGSKFDSSRTYNNIGAFMSANRIR